eukprot:12866808-Alexandrium_andersonii.AAC.1
MSASLVGSEMCIRDSSAAVLLPHCRRTSRSALPQPAHAPRRGGVAPQPCYRRHASGLAWPPGPIAGAACSCTGGPLASTPCV